MYKRLTEGISLGDNEEIVSRLKRIDVITSELEEAKIFLRKHILDKGHDIQAFSDGSISFQTRKKYDFTKSEEWNTINKNIETLNSELEILQEKLKLEGSCDIETNKSVVVRLKKEKDESQTDNTRNKPEYRDN
jgi:hypothetical protein